MTKKAEEKFSWLDLARAVLYLTGKRKRRYVVLTITLLVLLSYVVVPPFIVGLIVDFFTNREDGESLKTFYIYVALLGVSFSLVGYLRLSIKRALSSLKVEIEYDIKVRGFKKLIGQHYSHYTKESTGAKMQKIQSGTIAFHSLLSLFNNQIFQAIILFVGVVVIFLFLNPVYALLFCVYMVIFFIIVKHFYRKIQKLSYKRDVAKEQSSGSYVEGLSNILTIKAVGAEKSFQDNIANKEKMVRKHSLEGVIFINKQWKAFQIFNGIFISVFLLFIGRDVVNNVISVGTIVVYFTYLQRLMSSANQILGVYQDLVEIKISIGRMMPIFFRRGINKRAGRKFPKKWNNIQLVNVDFEYEKEKDHKILKGIKNLNLSIEKNKKIGFVGKTGSGKSTLAKLLIGLYKINSGEYLIGGKNFYDIKSEEIQTNISIVLQESEMFNLPLKDNITLMQNFDKELLNDAIEIAQLKEVVKKLPRGLDTVIGEKGYHLSGGEKQRVGIARAIYQNAQVMIFDEATSSLDNNTETLIQNAIESKLKKKTLIFIAHRITTLENVDKIYVFKNGKIVESGEYKKLLSNPESEFFRLSKKK